MLNTKSIHLKGTETFEEAYALMPEVNSRKIRFLQTAEGEPTGVYQISTDSGLSWLSPRVQKPLRSGGYQPVDIDSKKKLANAHLFYEAQTKPELVGSDAYYSWMIGQIGNCNILGDEYDVQGLIISTIFDPMPKYYISFERLVCENQFGTLGKNSSSMYIDMNKFLVASSNDDVKSKLNDIIGAEVEKRIAEADLVYNKLASVKLSDRKIKTMFQQLTIDKVSKENKQAYELAEQKYANYLAAYGNNDNQNFKRTLLGFVNACTNINTRTKETPLDVIKPVLPAKVIFNPMDFEYLCREAVIHAA